ncbi:DinB family protein [Glutamicibacter sp.]|uniref:DinB family protein n=1 Tax=Glutamicibacter sp. TaxID=1931995 RepID=UPI002B47500C|nr:DinB family protein [Glutamicibacter sp.]HJX77578.1 DinB family protein [Glutamicibacter sp.]
MVNLPAWEPPMGGTEQVHLLGMLDRLRVTFRYKADGLDNQQLMFRLPSSELSLGGLLQHLAAVEDEKFTYFIARERPEVLLELTADGRDQFVLNPEEDPAVLYRRYDAAVAKSRRIQAEVVSTGGLDALSALEYEGNHASVRRVICDLIEEYGRHTGHADLLREAIDGRVGEDAPFDYLPVWYA